MVWIMVSRPQVRYEVEPHPTARLKIESTSSTIIFIVVVVLDRLFPWNQYDWIALATTPYIFCHRKHAPHVPSRERVSVADHFFCGSLFIRVRKNVVYVFKIYQCVTLRLVAGAGLEPASSSL